MPVFKRDQSVAKAIAREAVKFAGHMRRIPTDREAAPHPELKVVLAGFKKVNGYLSQRGAKQEVSFARKARVGREFQRIGAALRKRPARARSAGKRSARKR